MTKVRVIAKRDFIESISTSAQPLAALSELIWNGFDSGSNCVKVFLNKNDMDGIDTITVQDYGDGINRDNIDQLFGNLGASWKKAVGRKAGRSLHGKNGRGRFKAFALGSHVVWDTNYEQNGIKYSYKITGTANAIDDFDVSDSVEASINCDSGTKVIVSNPPKNFRSLLSEAAPQELAKTFAPYLTEYPGVRLEFDGKLINPADVQNAKDDYNLGDITLPEGGVTNAALSVVEWNIQTDRTIYLCDANGISLHQLPASKKIKAPGFNYTAYIKSDYFRELDKDNLLVISDIHSGVQCILNAVSTKLQTHFRQKLSAAQSAIVEGWKQEKIYPYADDDNIGPIEFAERQVFDILAVNVQSYLPAFKKSDIKTKKFTFSLIAQALRQNPESVQIIISEVLGLKKETQDDLARLLSKTTLSSIISSSKVVANRLDFLNGLEVLLFDKESKQKLLERDQLHKILENEAWVFHEEFSLAASEQRLESVLKKHLGALGERQEDIGIVNLGDGKTGRVDLMLHKAVQPRTGEYDYLIVELKRPSTKINSEVLTQIEKYAIAVANDERFHGIKARWTFIAISNELDDYAKRKARQRGKPIGMVFDDDELNITVWAKSWADIINEAKSKLVFINQQLSYEADLDSTRNYLLETHTKFIPDVSIFAPPSVQPSSENNHSAATTEMELGAAR